MAPPLVARALKNARLATAAVYREGADIWRSTRAMEPGLRAANLDPDTRGLRYEQIDTIDGGTEIAAIPNDPTGEKVINPDSTTGVHIEFQRLLAWSNDANRALVAFIEDHSAFRANDIPDLTSDIDWCRLHLAIGVCEPRYRGDLCRWCYEFRLVHTFDPPRALLELRHDKGGKLTQTDVDGVLNPPTTTVPHPQSKRARKRARGRKK